MKLENTKPFSPLLTLREAASYAGIAPRTLYLHIAKGTGPNMFFGPDGKRRVSISALNTWILKDAGSEFDIEQHLDFLSPERAALFLECSLSSINHWRSNANAQNKKGYGPRFFRIGSHVVYLAEDLLRFKARLKHAV